MKRNVKVFSFKTSIKEFHSFIDAKNSVHLYSKLN